MRFRCQKSLLAALGVCLFFLPACSSLSPSGSGTGDSDTNNDAESENELFDMEGPVSLPLPPGKLKGIDAGKVIFLVSETKREECPLEVDIILEAGAVPDPTVTPKVAYMNLSRDDLFAFQAAQLDGSSEILGQCAYNGDRFYLANTTEAEDQTGPPVIAEIDGDGAVIVSKTNTVRLNILTKNTVDEKGNMYFVLENSPSSSSLTGKRQASTCNILRQNVDGTEFETILANSEDCPRALGVQSGQILVYVNQKGVLKSVEYKEGQLVGSFEYHDYGLSPDDTSGFEIKPRIVLSTDPDAEEITGECDHVLVPDDDRFKSADGKQVFTDTVCHWIGDEPELYRGEEKVERHIQSDAQHDPRKTEAGIALYLLFFDPSDVPGVRPDGSAFVISFDDASKDRYILQAADFPYIALSLHNSYDATRAVGSVYPVGGEISNLHLFMYTYPDDTIVRLTSFNETDSRLRDPQVSPNGDFIVACQLGAGDEANELVIYRPDRDAIGSFTRLTDASLMDNSAELSKENKSACEDRPGTFSIDGENNVHFYRNGQRMLIYATHNDLIQQAL